MHWTNAVFSHTAFREQRFHIFVLQVETIGDAYMVVSGAPNVNGNRHVAEIANMTLDLQDTASHFTIRHYPDKKLQMRCGFHTGMCAAGENRAQEGLARKQRFVCSGASIFQFSKVTLNRIKNVLQTAADTVFQI